MQGSNLLSTTVRWLLLPRTHVALIAATLRPFKQLPGLSEQRPCPSLDKKEERVGNLPIRNFTRQVPHLVSEKAAPKAAQKPTKEAPSLLRMRKDDDRVDLNPSASASA